MVKNNLYKSRQIGKGGLGERMMDMEPILVICGGSCLASDLNEIEAEFRLTIC